jgi:hypothetical protein
VYALLAHGGVVSGHMGFLWSASTLLATRFVTIA